uniref:Uncharacterized protein n=1 Tax=Anguilla anguilla TaxID=7936 RepID=A0A0E9WJ02_ANGAN
MWRLRAVALATFTVQKNNNTMTQIEFDLGLNYMTIVLNPK